MLDLWSFGEVHLGMQGNVLHLHLVPCHAPGSPVMSLDMRHAWRHWTCLETLNVFWGMTSQMKLVPLRAWCTLTPARSITYKQLELQLCFGEEIRYWIFSSSDSHASSLWVPWGLMQPYSTDKNWVTQLLYWLWCCCGGKNIVSYLSKVSWHPQLLTLLVMPGLAIEHCVWCGCLR